MDRTRNRGQMTRAGFMILMARNTRGFVRKPPDTENIPETYCGGYCGTYKKPSDVE